MQNNNIRVLFADDHEDIRLLVTTLLGASGYQVVTADGVASALALAHSEAFDVYLLDNKLPDGTGQELCERLREFDRDTPVVFFSGDAFDGDRQRALSAGAQGYVEKPNVSALPRAIASVLRPALRAH
ncbi:MAG TPA: response regulator [Pyrinomonadaceae bacterium]|jgi:CheY-like chemotaxis protein